MRERDRRKPKYALTTRNQFGIPDTLRWRRKTYVSSIKTKSIETHRWRNKFDGCNNVRVPMWSNEDRAKFWHRMRRSDIHQCDVRREYDTNLMCTASLITSQLAKTTESEVCRVAFSTRYYLVLCRLDPWLIFLRFVDRKKTHTHTTRSTIKSEFLIFQIIHYSLFLCE